MKVELRIGMTKPLFSRIIVTILEQTVTLNASSRLEGVLYELRKLVNENN